ncbi:MAG: acyl carrier protein [Anaerolineales bacterium]
MLRDDTAAADIDGWDSLAHITLMYTIEEMFGVQFSADEFARFTNVGDLKRSLEQRGFH